MVSEDSEREVIPTLTWKGLPYRVQILDSIVLVYDLTTRSQYAHATTLEDIRLLRLTKHSLHAETILKRICGNNITPRNITEHERTAWDVYGKVLDATKHVVQAEEAYDVTLTLSKAK